VRELRPDMAIFLEWVIMQLLVKSPDKRFQSARVLLEALTDFGLCV